MKRLMSVLLSAALMIGLAVPAFALDTILIDGYDGYEAPNQLSINNIVKEDTTVYNGFEGTPAYIAQGPVTITLTDDVCVFEATVMTPEADYYVDGGSVMPKGKCEYWDETGTHPIEIAEAYARQEELGIEMWSFLKGATITLEEPGLYYVCARYEAIAGAADAVINVVSDTPTEPAKPATGTTKPAAFAAALDGSPIDLTAFVINDFNHIKLRDMAALLKDTGAKFNVGWDGKSVTLTTGETYTPGADDLADVGTASKTYTENKSAIVVDGKTVELTAYNIDGYNYFQLRDLGEALGFSVGWDNATRTVTIGTK